MKCHLLMKVVSVKHTHGGKEERTRAVKAAAVNKVKAILNRQGESPQQERERSQRSDAKAYGSHNGSTHTKVLLDVELSDTNADEVLSKINYSARVLESWNSLDIPARKREHRLKKQEIMEKYKQKYGTKLTEKQFTQYKNEYAKETFKYVATQVEITIISDEQLQGSIRLKDGSWLTRVYTKTYYSDNILTSQQLSALDCNSNSIELKVTTSTSRCGALIELTESGQLRVIRLDDLTSLEGVEDKY